MDLRNVVFAIALSFAVLFGWSVIFETPQIEEQKKLEQTQGLEKNDNKNNDAPSVNIEKERVLNISRDDAIKSVKRVNFENENVKGSISVKGFLIDDIVLFNVLPLLKHGTITEIKLDFFNFILTFCPYFSPYCNYFTNFKSSTS